MGCGSQKAVLGQAVGLPIVSLDQTLSSKVEILPSTFVQINENRFEQMYKLGTLLGEGSNGEVTVAGLS